MATETEIIGVLDILQAAYPSYKPANPAAMLDIYTRKLARFPVRVLNLAADQLIDESKFFPAISELVEKASSIRQPVVIVSLEERRQALEDRFYLDGEFDPSEWRTLAQDFSRADRGEGAAAIERRREAIQESEGEKVIL